MFGLLRADRRIRPMMATTIRLLAVMLRIMAAHAGIGVPNMSGGSRKSHRYPPTMNPMMREASTHARSLRLLRVKMTSVARKFAAEPKTTSIGFTAPKAITPPPMLPTKHPIVAPQMIGHPNKAASGSKQSANRS